MKVRILGYMLMKLPMSNWEQLGVIVRYIKNSRPVEKLLEYVICDDIKGRSIATFLINILTNVNLDSMMCRSQTYNDAGNMPGKVKGTAAVFCSETGNDKVVYFHCASHELNLCLSKASKVPQIYNMISIRQALGIFFKYSPRRQRKIEVLIADVTNTKI